MLFVATPPPEPAWVQQPTAAQLDRIETLYVQGAASAPRQLDLDCYVRADGRLEACRMPGSERVAAPLSFVSQVAALYQLDRSRYAAPRVRFSVAFRKLYDTPAALETPPKLEALQAIRTSGKAALLCAVDVQGALKDCAVEQGGGADLQAAAAALRAAPLYRLKPAMLRGSPVESWARLPVNFSSSFTIVHPNWLRKPTLQELAKAYPVAAARSGIAGRAVIQCRVLHTGSVTDCRVLAEEPPETGFGEAALQLSRILQMKPELHDGAPSDDGEVTIPMLFKMPGSSSYLTTVGSTAGGGPPALADKVKVLTWVPFLQAPTLAELAAAYPASARRRQVFGHTALRCRLTAEGGLTACVGLGAADPENFEKAARSLLPRFRPT